MLGLHCCVGFLCSCRGWGLLSSCNAWLLSRRLLLFSSTGRRCTSSPALERGSVLGRTGLVALWCVGSSRTRDRTHVSCVGSASFTTEPPGKPCPAFLGDGNTSAAGSSPGSATVLKFFSGRYQANLPNFQIHIFLTYLPFSCLPDLQTLNCLLIPQ